MAASFPTAVKSFTTKADGVDIAQAAHINDIQDEVTAIEQGLLVGPLSVPADMTFEGTVDVAGEATFEGAVNANNALVVAGGASFSGGVNINTAALTLNVGQIVFPAAQNAAAGANTLDDYEEGSFQMTLVSAGGGAPTYTNRTCYYMKIGQFVHFYGLLTLATLGTLAAGGLTITGLPFTVGNLSGGFGGHASPYWANLNANKIMVGTLLSPNSATITVTALGAAATSTGQLNQTDLTGTSEWIVQGSFRATA